MENETVKIRIISKSGSVPKYETPGSAGFDLPAFLDEPVTLAPGQRMLVPTGIYMDPKCRRFLMPDAGYLRLWLLSL